MTSTIPSQATRSVAVSAEFFGALSASAERNPAAIGSLRDAGYAAGVALYDTFTAWLEERGEGAPAFLPDERFGPLMGEFLSAAGWGSLEVHSLSSAVMALDTEDWAEATEGAATEAPACHVGTGLLAGFLGRVADAPLAVLEVECRSTGASRCRFLVGSVDVLGYVYEALQRGVPYERAAMSAATG
jgi:predicted hydrocarbon binding protein